jgi:DNA-binding GntR family transcriptional regulator
VSSLRPLTSTKSLTARVRESLRDAIVRRDLAPGELYSVQKLADLFGVSRTPVREALLELAELELVRFERNRGVRIIQASPKDLLEIFRIRLLLEVPATHHATSLMSDKELAQLQSSLEQMATAAATEQDEALFMNHDRRFHVIILEATKNDRLVAYVEGLRDIVLTRGSSTLRSSRSFQDIVDEHEAILRKIEARDACAASSAMHAHIERTGTLLIEQVGGDPSELIEGWSKLNAVAGTV